MKIEVRTPKYPPVAWEGKDLFTRIEDGVLFIFNAEMDMPRESLAAFKEWDNFIVHGERKA